MCEHLPVGVLFTVASLLFTPILFLCEKSVNNDFQLHLQQHHPVRAVFVALRCLCRVKWYTVTLVCVLLSIPFPRTKCSLLVRNLSCLSFLNHSWIYCCRWFKMYVIQGSSRISAALSHLWSHPCFICILCLSQITVWRAKQAFYVSSECMKQDFFKDAF